MSRDARQGMLYAARHLLTEHGFIDFEVGLAIDVDEFTVTARHRCGSAFRAIVHGFRSRHDKERAIDAIANIEEQRLRDGCLCPGPKAHPPEACWSTLYGAAWSAA